MTEEQTSWTSEHFSLCNPLGSDEQASVPALRRRVAASLEEKGDIRVMDLVLHDDLDDDGSPWPFVTVYFSR